MTVLSEDRLHDRHGIYSNGPEDFYCRDTDSIQDHVQYSGWETSLFLIAACLLVLLLEHNAYHRNGYLLETGRSGCRPPLLNPKQ